MSKAKERAFAKDLATVLEKHDASLCIMLEGDTHGIFGEGIGVQFVQKRTEHFTLWEPDARLCNGYILSVRELHEAGK